MAEDSEIITRFQKNSQEEIRFCIANFKGREYVDIRIFYSKDGDFLPSKKGITVALDTWSDFRHSIEKLETTLRERELISSAQEGTP